MKEIKFNKNKKEFITGIISSLSILIIMILATKGYAELIQDVSINKLTFFTVIMVFFIIKLGNSFSLGLRLVFVKNKKGVKK